MPSSQNGEGRPVVTSNRLVVVGGRLVVVSDRMAVMVRGRLVMGVVISDRPVVIRGQGMLVMVRQGQASRDQDEQNLVKVKRYNK